MAGARVGARHAADSPAPKPQSAVRAARPRPDPDIAAVGRFEEGQAGCSHRQQGDRGSGVKSAERRWDRRRSGPRSRALRCTP